MSTFELVHGERRRSTAPAVGVLACLVALAWSVVNGGPSGAVAPAIAFASVVIAFHRTLLAWRNLLAGILFVILFIPIRRYTVPLNLPIQLEPYRVIVGLVSVGWLASLLVDPRVRLRRSVVDAPLLLFFFFGLVSLLVNPARFQEVSGDAVKRLIFFVSFMLVFYFVVSVIRRAPDVDFILKSLILGGSVVAIFAIVESRTGFNVFNRLDGVIPYLELPGEPEIQDRGGRYRVFASAQHPIALGAALAILIPLAAVIARRAKRRVWWLPVILLLLGVLTTSSRTAVLMLAVEGLVFLWLRPQEVRRLWPALIPALVVIHFAVPGALGTTKQLFFPQGGVNALIAEQDKAEGTGRIAAARATLSDEFSPHPLFGIGFGTRITQPTELTPRPNARLLDNEWVGMLAETGLVGALTLLWVFVRFVRRSARQAKDDRSSRGLLFVAFAASIGAYAVGMLTYDAFSFIQVTFLMFVILGLGCSSLAGAATDRRSPAPV